MSQEDNAIQAVETVGGVLSFVACAYMIYKFSKKKGIESSFTNKIFLMFFMINLPLSALIAIGRSAIQNPGFCTFQGFVIQWLLNAYMLWIMLLSYLMHLWIVQKQHPKRMEKIFRKNVAAILCFSFSLAIILLGVKAYGDAYIWCWIDDNNQIARFLCIELFLVVAWVVNTHSVMTVERALRQRFKRASFHEKIAQILDSNDVSIQQKLTVYLSVFSFIWFFALLNRVVELITGNTNFITGLLEALFLPLQGFLYAICYYPAIQQYIWCIKASKEVTLLRQGVINTHHTYTSKQPTLREIFVEPTLANMTMTQRTQKAYIPKKYSIYVTTFNMGEALPQLLQSNIKDWIVEGHDVYVIGLQECMDLVGLRDMILNHLGGASKYQMHGVAIGSDNKSLGFHGFIALTVYIKLTEVLDGSIIATSPAKSTMATGADLIITTAQNKGAVGIPLQIHDTSIGFVTCHLPSDSKGKSKLSKRNASAHAILKEVTLAPEDLNFDLHLQHDHMIICGDLNYRMDTAGDGDGVNSLTGVAVACNIEKQTFNEDSNWNFRKFNLLRHHTDPLYPSLSETKIIHSAKLNSKGAWRSVLRADELRSIMDDGDAFYHFEEPMPCFPPSYKRRKGSDADCGDYSDFTMVIKGYSNTGYVENLLLKQQQELEKNRKTLAKQRVGSITGTITAGFEKIRRKSSLLLTAADSNEQGDGNGSKRSSAKNMLLEVNKEDDEEKSACSSILSPLPALTIEASALLALDTTNTTTTLASTEEEEARDSSSLSLAGGASSTVAAAGTDSPHHRKRRGGHENNLNLTTKSPESSLQHKEDPSKLRPPSYTDRVLVHSLPDRVERLTIQAYDSCDLIRVSDHRPVSMTLLVEVNAAVNYHECVHKDDHSQAMVVTSSSVKEPQFELYELTITNFTVVLVDLSATADDEDEEDEDDLEDDDDFDNNNEEIRDTMVPNDFNSATESSKTDGRISTTSSKAKQRRGSQFTATNPLHASTISSSKGSSSTAVSHHDSSSGKTVSVRFSQPASDYDNEDDNEDDSKVDVNDNNDEKVDDDIDSLNHGITLFPSSTQVPVVATTTITSEEEEGQKQQKELQTVDEGTPSTSIKKKKKVGGIRFSDDLIARDSDYSTSQKHNSSSSVSIELTSSSSKYSSPSPSRSHSSVTGSDRRARGISFARSSVIIVPPAAGAVTAPQTPARRKSVFYSLYLLASGKKDSATANTADTDADNDKEAQRQENLAKQQQEQAIVDMARDSLAWQNTLHVPGEWRKRVMEEERQHREAKATNVKTALKTKVRQLRRKSNKNKGSSSRSSSSGKKSIASITVIFPLPTKDPLLSYRRAYDYAAAFSDYDDSQRLQQQLQPQQQAPDDIESNTAAASSSHSNTTTTTRDELLHASSVFDWHPLFSTDRHSSSRRRSSQLSTTSGSSEALKQRENKFDSCDTFKVKGCASTELGAHALLKVTAKDGSDLGSSVVCVSHLLHVDPGLIKSSNMSQIPLSSGGQKRGHISGKFSLRYLPSSLSVHNE